MKKYTYTIPDASDDNTYLLYEVRDANTDEVIIHFYTNKGREGCFFYDESKHIYRQTAGTCQFYMPASRDAARAKLRRMAEADDE